MSVKSFWAAVKETFIRFVGHRPFVLAAALSYYTLLSLAPLLLIMVSAAGMIFGQRAVRGELVAQIRSTVGESGAQAIQTILANASGPGRGILSMTIGVVTLVLGATTALGQLQASLNQIWEVQARPGRGAIWNLIRTRLVSLALILGGGLLLVLSVVLSAVVASMRDALGEALPGGGWLWQGLELLVSLIIFTLLIAAIFKYLPDVKIAWRDVWVGAAITAVLFAVGKFLIGLYLGRAGVGSPFGAAGSLVVLLVWVFYSALILFFGAQITQVYVHRSGRQIEPADYAMRVPRQPAAGSPPSQAGESTPPESSEPSEP